MKMVEAFRVALTSAMVDSWSDAMEVWRSWLRAVENALDLVFFELAEEEKEVVVESAMKAAHAAASCSPALSPSSCGASSFSPFVCAFETASSGEFGFAGACIQSGSSHSSVSS